MSTEPATSICALRHGSAPAELTIADLQVGVAADSGLGETRRRSVDTSLRRLCRLLGLDPGTTPADPNKLLPLVHKVRPAKLGLRKDRWRNIVTDLRFALRWAGFAGVPGRDIIVPSQAWVALLDELPQREERMRIGRFARWATRRGVEPRAITQADLDCFLAELQATPQSGKSAMQTVDRLVRAWNVGVEHVGGWPPTRLASPVVSNRWTLPLSAYPASLRVEISAYLERLSGADPFDAEAPAKPLRPVTIEAHRNHLRAYCAALVVCGRDAGTLVSLADLVEPDRAKIGLRYLLARSPTGNTGYVAQVAALLCALAQHAVRVDDEQLRRLHELRRRLSRRVATGLTEKNRERLRQFDDPRHVAALLHLPGDLMRAAERNQDKPRRAALDAQLAVAIELLLMAPLRIGNLAGLRIDEHLSWTRGPRGTAHLVVPAGMVKNNEPLEFELPGESARLVRAYLERYRPLLAKSDDPWLFPGRGDRAKHTAVLASQLTRTIRERTGLDVHPHLFRHLGAKLYLTRNPGGYEVVRRVLGHRSLATTTAFYTGTETAAAVQHFDSEILRLRASTMAATWPAGR